MPAESAQALYTKGSEAKSLVRYAGTESVNALVLHGPKYTRLTLTLSVKSLATDGS